MSGPSGVPSAIGGFVLALVATVAGAAAAGLLPLAGLMWEGGGLTESPSWEDGEGHFLVASAGFCVLVWLVLLGLSLTMCLGEEQWRTGWQKSLAVSVGVISVVTVAASFANALSALSAVA